ncbi:TraR/DksA C4-type zinc finger protein [Streptomyces sp. RK62]|uniref:TraR/DksA C4-type zinc finger protein n=1 Tax=Streptomyces sp. RK62 TaxID=2824893 RepID=UPI001B38B215|nr:TraR/DksA C4-type zinc finger protein [Streptomyces sp. RK62]MBQ0999594.1 TraR/DksA C4-type zinc finger protein [Streptomyces sp. RK62]
MSLDTTPSDSAHRPQQATADEIRRRLEHERAARLTQLRALAEAGEEAEAEQLMSGQKETLERVLKEIDAAFARVEAGGYGTCQGCDRPIPAERLEILPYARYCVPCQRATT